MALVKKKTPETQMYRRQEQITFIFDGLNLPPQTSHRAGPGRPFTITLLHAPGFTPLRQQCLVAPRKPTVCWESHSSSGCGLQEDGGAGQPPPQGGSDLQSFPWDKLPGFYHFWVRVLPHSFKRVSAELPFGRWSPSTHVILAVNK